MIRKIGMFCASFFYAYKDTAFCFYIYGPLQVVSYDQWHCFDAVEIR